MLRRVTVDKLAFRLYVRAHGVGWMIGGIAATVLLQCAVGVQRIMLPNSVVVFPYRMLLPLGLAVSVLGVTRTEVREQERVAAVRVHSVETCLIGCAAFVCAGLEWAVAGTTTSLSAGTVWSRSFAVWLLLGLSINAVGLRRAV